MASLSLTVALLALIAPPDLPDVDGDEQSPPSSVEPGPAEPESPPGEVAPPAEPPAEDPTNVAPPADPGPPADAAPPTEAPPADEAVRPPAPTPPPTTAPAIQSPTIREPSPTTPSSEPAPARPATQQPTPDPDLEPAPEPGHPEGPRAPESLDEARGGEDEDEDDGRARKLGGFRFVRIGIAPKVGYTNGTSERNGIFDREKSIQQSMESGQVVVAEGDDEDVRFGGGMWGFEADLEFFGVNVLLDFHKFFRPGGMWSLLLGYDHEFGLGKKKERLRIDVGAHFGMMRVFLGKALEDLYYDPNNPEAVNIATAGLELRLMTALQIKIAGPLFTGPALMGGWHYLWSANAAKATKEQGLHFNAAWTLRLDFAIPKNRPGG